MNQMVTIELVKRHIHEILKQTAYIRNKREAQNVSRDEMLRNVKHKGPNYT